MYAVQTCKGHIEGNQDEDTDKKKVKKKEKYLKTINQ